MASRTASGPEPIYLDHNATTPVLPEVLEAMLPYLRGEFGNPSSGHALGARAKEAVEHARGEVAVLLGARSDEIVFTSGGTEANNLSILGLIDHVGASASRRIVTSVVEHPATARPCDRMERLGFVVDRVGVDSEGRIELDAMGRALDEPAALVTIIHAQNETGVIQPIESIARLARANGAMVHTDAAQSVGKVPIDVRAMGVDQRQLLLPVDDNYFCRS